MDWISHELTANGYQMPSSFDPTSADWGLTIDSVLALAGGGRGAGSAASKTATNVIKNAGSYITGRDFGSPNDRYAGAIGKLLLMTLIEKRDPTKVDGYNLLTEARARMQTSGAQAGRFSDHSDFGDFSNGLGQALNIMALARTPGGVPPLAVRFLLAQQCPDGGFRLTYDSGNSCTNNTDADTDTTALSVQALLAVPTAHGATGSLAKAVAYLRSVQDPTTGSFASSGSGGEANANTTGLASAALRGAGRTYWANRAGSWVASAQLTVGNVGTGPAQADAGAIAYNPADKHDAITNGISASGRDQFRRATTQGIFALGLSPYGSI